MKRHATDMVSLVFGSVFIFITGWADCSQVAIQIKRGVTVLQKPFDIEKLMSCVVAHLD